MSADPAFRTTIRLRGVSKAFGAGAGSCTAGVAALDDASVEIRGGEVLLVCGPRGAGKTTLLLCAAGLLHCDAGDVVGGHRRVAYRDLARPSRIDAWPDGRRSFSTPAMTSTRARTARATLVGRDGARDGAAIVLAARDPERASRSRPPTPPRSASSTCALASRRQRAQIGAVHRVAEKGRAATRVFFVERRWSSVSEPASPRQPVNALSLLYNSLTRSTDPFAPADGKLVRIYSCGPTVYNPAHLGNFRTFLFADLLRRALRFHGWNVRQVMNITDVDDKIIKRAAEQKKTITQVTEPVTAIFHADREYLRIEPAEEYPKATSYIPQMIALVERLIERGLAYQADDRSVYFAIDRFPEYGRLSRLDRREVRPARASRRTTTRRRTRRTSRCGSRRSPKTKRPAPHGTRRGAAAVPAGTSSARRWRSSCLARRSTSTAAASTWFSRITRTRSPSPRVRPGSRSPVGGAMVLFC